MRAALMILFLIGLVALPFGNAAENKPNILFIAIDDLRISLGCYGDVAASTPHLHQTMVSIRKPRAWLRNPTEPVFPLSMPRLVESWSRSIV
jgi:hypothetical protein